MSRQIKRILSTTDLSPAAPQVFEYALFLANQFNAHVTSLHVVEELSQEAKFAFATYFGVEEGRDLAHKREKEVLEEMKTRVRLLCDKQMEGCELIDSEMLKIMVTKGYPEEQILKVSKEIQADIIIMGAHEKGITHTFLGTVAKRVLRRSRIPVIIVPLINDTPSISSVSI